MSANRSGQRGTAVARRAALLGILAVPPIFYLTSAANSEKAYASMNPFADDVSGVHVDMCIYDSFQGRTVLSRLDGRQVVVPVQRQIKMLESTGGMEFRVVVEFLFVEGCCGDDSPVKETLIDRFEFPPFRVGAGQWVNDVMPLVVDQNTDEPCVLNVQIEALQHLEGDPLIIDWERVANKQFRIAPN